MDNRVCKKCLLLEAAEKGEIAMYDTPQNVFSHADKLESLGLTVPGVTKICTEMNRRGIKIPTTICTEEALIDWFKGVKRHA